METALIIVNIVLTLALAAFVLLRRANGSNTSADADVVLKAHESFLTELHRFGESIGVMERRLREELRLSETTTRDALTKLISLARDDQLTAATTLRTEVSKNLACGSRAALYGNLSRARGLTSPSDLVGLLRLNYNRSHTYHNDADDNSQEKNCHRIRVLEKVADVQL
jgi:hypothetical protein